MIKNKQDYYKKKTIDAILNDALSNRGRLKQESIDNFKRKPYYLLETQSNKLSNK